MKGSLLTLITASAWLNYALGQACPPISADDVTFEGTYTGVSTGTRVLVQPLQTANVETCGEAFVGSQGYAIVRGGTVTLSGGTGFERATASYTAGAIPTATGAVITVAPGADLSLGAAASAVSVVVSGTRNTAFVTIPATATVPSGIPAVTLLATGQGATGILQGGGPGDVVRAEYGGNIQATLSGGQILATFGSSVYVQGPSNTGSVINGGRVTLVGEGNSCYVSGYATCTVDGNNARVRATGGFAAVAIPSTVTGGQATASSGGIVTIRGDNTAYYLAGATGAVIEPAQATIYSGVEDTAVTVNQFATAYMELGARVAALGRATLTAYLPGTTISSVSERGGYTIFEAVAGAAPSAKRRSLPAVPFCGGSRSPCVVPGMGVRCVDTTTDLFNCGGCALEGTGQDCTELAGSEDGLISCQNSRCVRPIES